jgi:F0F1-type ATP synthase assembly protein I
MAPVGLGVGAGYEVDAHFGVKPWGTLGGSMVGIVLGFTAFLITTSKLLEKKK